jgi:Trp operon repressor
MTHISKEPLANDVWEKIWAQCINAFAQQKTHKEIEDSLTVLFTKSERTVLAKRVSIVLMLRGGYSTRTIAEALHVSTNTVSRWRDRLDVGEFRVIERHLRNPGTAQRLLATIEALLYASMPPIAGRNRFGAAMKKIEKARERGSYL